MQKNHSFSSANAVVDEAVEFESRIKVYQDLLRDSEATVKDLRD
jgi:hypothetical protein